MNLFGKKRNTRFAGTWYQNNPDKLKSEIELYLENAQSQRSVNRQEPLQAIVSPHAGYMYSGATAAYSFNCARQNKSAVKRILLLGPSHYANIGGVALCSYSAYNTALGDLPIDQKALKSLLQSEYFQIQDAIHEREHSLELQTPFIRHIFGEIPLIPLVVGSFLDGANIRSCANDLSKISEKGDLWIVSSDFTHFGPRYDYVPFYENISENIKTLDTTAFSYLANLDLNGLLKFHSETDCTICGFNPLCLMVASLPQNSKGNLLHYETSRAQGSDDDLNSVSYLAISFGTKEPDMSISELDKINLLKIARSTADFFTRTGKKPKLDQLPPDIVLSDFMKKPMGVFVSFFIKDPAPGEEELRGCIGYILPMMPLFEAVIDNAIGACSKDYRFPPVQHDELKRIKIEISVLTSPVEIACHEAIEIGKHGVLLHCKGRQSVFLPHVATQYGWDVVETLNQLAQKAGLKQDAWRKGAKFEIFESVLFEEHE